MSFNRVVGPALDPVSLLEVKAHLRIDNTEEDDLLKLYIGAATGYAEEFLCRALCSQTWELSVDGVPDRVVKMPRPPLQSVESVKYLDNNGQELTVPSDIYYVSSRSEPGLVVLRNECSWPSTHWPIDTYRFTYQAGYGDTERVPEPVKQAILLHVAHLFDHRESVITGTIVSEMPMTTHALLSPYRMAVL